MLALALGKTVGELQATLTQREFASWQKFYRSHPFDDAHRHHRPAALIAGAFGGSGADAMKDRLEWLRNEQKEAAPPVAVPEGSLTQADIETIKAMMGG